MSRQVGDADKDDPQSSFPLWIIGASYFFIYIFFYKAAEEKKSNQGWKLHTDRATQCQRQRVGCTVCIHCQWGALLLVLWSRAAGTSSLGVFRRMLFCSETRKHAKQNTTWESRGDRPRLTDSKSIHSPHSNHIPHGMDMEWTDLEATWRLFHCKRDQIDVNLSNCVIDLKGRLCINFSLSLSLYLYISIYTCQPNLIWHFLFQKKKKNQTFC